MSQPCRFLSRSVPHSPQRALSPPRFGQSEPGGGRLGLGPGQRRNFRHRQMPQQPVGLAAGRHLHGVLRHERLHQRSDRLRLPWRFAQQTAAAVAEDRARFGRGATSAKPQALGIERGRQGQLFVADGTRPRPAVSRSERDKSRPAARPRRSTAAASSERSIVPGPATRMALPSSRRPRRKRARWIVASPMPLRRCGK